MKKAIHALNLMEMVDGSWRLYGHTLCGRPAPDVGLSGASADPDAVTCKRCRDSRAWPHFYVKSIEHRKQGRLP